MNKKVEDTRQRLFDALLELMKQKTMREITVTELCRSAGIHRTTFYRHFSIPQDIFDNYLHDYTKRVEGVILSTFDEGNYENDIYLKMLRLCEMAYESYGAFFSVFCSGYNIQTLIQPVFDFLLRQEYASFEDRARQTFVIGGISALYVLWCQNAFQPAPEEMARLMSDLALSDSHV